MNLNQWSLPRWTRGLLAVGLISEGSLWFAAGIARPEDFNVPDERRAINPNT
jgi:hypothetical protein